MGNLYEFKQEDAYDFARFVGAETKVKGDELTFKSCPYCRGGKHNDRYSFGINLRTGQFSCFRSSCGAAGNMTTLSKDFDFSLGNIVDPYYKPNKIQYRKFKRPEPREPKSNLIEYMEGRKIPKEIVEKYYIRTKKDDDNIIAFPFMDERGDVVFIKYRPIIRSESGSKEWCEEKCKPILFGMYQCNLDNKTLIMTEGQIDSLSVAAVGYENAVSVPIGCNGFTWLPHCWDWLQNFETLVVFGDYEKGRMTLLSEMSARFNGAVKHVRYEDYIDCKDANAILVNYGPDQIRKCIDNAEPLPVNHVLDITEVQPLDVSKIIRVGMGISQANNLLNGGLALGGVTIIAGKTGEGKSVLSSQIMANAIYQGHKVFIYSGELPNGQAQMLLYYQIAGSNLMESIPNHYGDYDYMLSDFNRAKIDEVCRGRAFILDHNCIYSEETINLLRITEEMIVQRGVDVVLLDNLMTAMELGDVRGADLYERQSSFVRTLAALAIKYGVLIILVAHKRKAAADNDNDTISGSSNIGNLATFVLSYAAPSKTDIENGTMTADQRRLLVTKNRLTGKVTRSGGYILNYDPASRRIYGVGDDYKNSLINDFESIPIEQLDLPFE